VVGIDASGRTRWSAGLPTRPHAGPAQAAPLVDASRAYVAEDGVVHAVAVGDGRQVWSWPGGASVYAMWRWQELVVVLVDQVGDRAHLDGLDAATGARRWTLRLPKGGLYDVVHDTGDGGLAMVRADGVVQVVDMATGRVRWQHEGPRFAPLAVVDGVVVDGKGGVLTGYGSRTGARRWRLTGFADDPELSTGPAGLLLAGNASKGPGSSPLVAVRAGTGTVAWRYDAGTAVQVLGVGPAGVVVETLFVRQRALLLLAPDSGRVRWRAPGVAHWGTLAHVGADDVVLVEGGVPELKRVALVDRAASDGHVRWQARLPFTPVEASAPQPFGPGYLVLGMPAKPAGPAPLLAVQDGGRWAWQANAPTLVQRGAALTPAGDLAVLHASDGSWACPA
jgi:outer membrane protein assembly factor BamB